MSPVDHNQLVQNAEAEVEKVRAEAERIVMKLKESMPMHLKEMADKVVENVINQNPEAIKVLGDDGRKKMKKEISDVVANFPEEVNKNFASGIVWAHTKKLDMKKQDYQLDDTLKKETYTALSDIGQLILGMIGSVFINYGITQLGANSYWKKIGSSSVLFSYGLDFYHHTANNKFQENRKLYDAVTGNYVGAMRNLATKQDDKNRADAKKLWDEA